MSETNEDYLKSREGSRKESRAVSERKPPVFMDKLRNLTSVDDKAMCDSSI